MITHPYIDAYEKSWRNGKILLNQERIDLIHYLRKVVLNMDDIYFNEEQIQDFVDFTEKWFFKLEPFQKFLVCFVFLYHADGSTVFNIFFWTMARGAGKNGLISALAAYFISPLNNIPEYHVAIVANSERQAKKSFEEVYNMIERNPPLKYHRKKNPGGHFVNRLSRISCHSNFSTLEYLTSNADTKDSFAHGVVIFDEIHQYENYEIIDVLTDGLGKVQPPRTFYISTNGYVRDGVYDKELDKAREVLKHTEFQSRIFPWICTLDEKDEVKNAINWQKSNPMFHEPMSSYAKGLFGTVTDQWGEVQRGERDKAKWLTKRMNIDEVELETSVATREEILATNRPIPNLQGYRAIGGLDYASMRDFAAVGVLVRDGDEFIWETHSFIRKAFLDSFHLKISEMIPEWEREGLLTVLDEPAIGISHIVQWFEKMNGIYDIELIVADNYRADLVKQPLENAGFETEFIRRSGGVEATVAPQIEVLFAQQQLIWDENPLMNWYTNNVYVKRDKFGNMKYDKKDEVRRKTDGFMAFVHAFWRGKDLLTGTPSEFMFSDFFD